MAGLQVQTSSSKFQFSTTDCAAEAPESASPQLNHWFFLDIVFDHPSLSARVIRSFSGMQCSDACFQQTTSYEKAYVLGEGSEGSFRQFTLFDTALPMRQLLQLRAGLSPSPYEENNLLVFY